MRKYVKKTKMQSELLKVKNLRGTKSLKNDTEQRKKSKIAPRKVKRINLVLKNEMTFKNVKSCTCKCEKPKFDVRKNCE